MQKYGKELTDEQLTDKINEIGEEPEERETPDISQAIVDGYIFSVDRTIPKILDYLGPANEVIITASVNGNKDGWFIQGDTVNVTVTGKIKTYSGGTITNVSATINETAIEGFSIDSEGKYIINNITEDTTIVITAKDSNNNKGTKTIPVTIKIDTVPPTVSDITTSWIESEDGTNKLKVSLSNIEDMKSGLNENSVKLYITPENEERVEKRIALTGNVAESEEIEGLNKESKTIVEVIVTDVAGNKVEKLKNVGRIYLVKDGEIVRGEKTVLGQYGHVIENNSVNTIDFYVSNDGYYSCFSRFDDR